MSQSVWTTEQLGLAVWSRGGSKWHVDARGGDAGIGVVAGHPGDPAELERAGRVVSLNAVQPDSLPRAGEHFVCGDRWCVNYPQDAGSYALRLAFEAIESSKDLLVLEVTVSIQTDLLDTHPTIDLEVPGRSIDSIAATELPGGEAVEGGGTAPISIVSNDDHCVCALLGPHDSPFTTSHSTRSLLRLRLFGDFLEKGVIRKARPWIVIDRSSNTISRDRLETWWQLLSNSPLPLTP